jgi:spore photoproduct lyase
VQLNNLFIDRQVSDNPIVNAICKRISVHPTYVDSPESIYEMLMKSDDPVSLGKKSLFLTRNKGTFIRECPGTSNYTCCNYKILHIGTYCTMDCAYCILQSYFHPPLLQFFVNHEELFDNLDSIFSQKKIIRIGTGEYTDSLIWESIYPFSAKLVSKFSNQTHGVLELKTKTIHIEHLLDLKHNRKTILAWSLNTEKAIREWEKKTASLSARLNAAHKCEASGYPLAFHFDPLFMYPDCETDYDQVIRFLFKNISPENIVWISLGSFRFMPDLKYIIEKRFPKSNIAYGEFIKGLDGKMRYFKPMRIQLYKKIIAAIKNCAPDVMIYFCMEDDDVWKKTLGYSPSEFGGLPQMLDESASKHCGIMNKDSNLL